MSAVQINVYGLHDYTKVHYASWVLLLFMYTDESWVAYYYHTFDTHVYTLDVYVSIRDNEIIPFIASQMSFITDINACTMCKFIKYVRHKLL